MRQEEILKYNKRCSEFLGYVNTTPTDKDFNIYKNEKGMIIGNKIYTMIELMSARFHSDWNWIHELVEAIEKLRYLVVIQSNFCQIQEIGVKENNFNPYIITSLYGKDKKEAAVQAINQFLIWYNNESKN